MAKSTTPLAFARFEDRHSDTVMVLLGSEFLLCEAIDQVIVWNCHVKEVPQVERIDVSQVGPFVEQMMESYGTEDIFLTLGLEGYNNTAPETSRVRAASREAFHLCMQAPLVYTVMPYTDFPEDPKPTPNTSCIMPTSTPAPSPIDAPSTLLTTNSKTVPVFDHLWCWRGYYVLALASVAVGAMLFFDSQVKPIMVPPHPRRKIKVL